MIMVLGELGPLSCEKGGVLGVQVCTGTGTVSVTVVGGGG